MLKSLSSTAMTASEISASSYASRRKELLSLINQLRAAGAQNELDLPRITVIGNQSAGKSSLVEAISGITVPRDAGTCTRCPMECRLSSSDGPWSCRISIRYEFDTNGKALRQVLEKRFGDVITDKSLVELSLRRAQYAVLNPDVPWSKVFSASAEDLAEWSPQSNSKTSKPLRFSQNVVCVDLDGPELTDLSFIDLPGLIQNADPDVVQLVENMALSHIKGNCIILVAVPMTDDIENQKAFRLARQEDPNGQRTIGVLTKPDMLATGSKKAVKLWMDVLQGKRHPLLHGYFCTRQPDDDERANNISPENAREAEETFFRGTSPWNASSSERCGTKNLVETLSRLLVRVISASLPDICTETDQRLRECTKQLSDIPPPLTEDPAMYLLSSITKFAAEFQTQTQSSSPSPSPSSADPAQDSRSHSLSLIQSHRAVYRTLKVAIRGTIPKFIPFADDESSAQSEFAGELGIGDSEEEDECDTGNAIDDVDDEHSSGSMAMANAIATSNSNTRPMNLSDMSRHISRSISRELPNSVPFAAKLSLIREFQRTWPVCVDACFERVRLATIGALMKKVERDYGRFGVLKSKMRSLLLELVETHRAACKLALSKVLEVELMPFTQNTHYLEAKTEVYLAKLKSARNGMGKGKGKMTLVSDGTWNRNGNRIAPVDTNGEEEAETEMVSMEISKELEVKPSTKRKKNKKSKSPPSDQVAESAGAQTSSTIVFPPADYKRSEHYTFLSSIPPISRFAPSFSVAEFPNSVPVNLTFMSLPTGAIPASLEELRCHSYINRASPSLAPAVASNPPAKVSFPLQRSVAATPFGRQDDSRPMKKLGAGPGKPFGSTSQSNPSTMAKEPSSAPSVRPPASSSPSDKWRRAPFEGVLSFGSMPQAQAGSIQKKSSNESITSSSSESSDSSSELSPSSNSSSPSKKTASNPPAAAPAPTASSAPSSNTQYDPIEGKDDEFKDILDKLAKLGLHISSKKELLAKIGPGSGSGDGYETEMRVMAEVQGYFQVAYKRVIDYIPGFIDLVFVRAIEQDLQSFLVLKFELGTPSASERCATYLGEDASIVARREELLSMKSRLESVQRELNAFSFQ